MNPWLTPLLVASAVQANDPLELRFACIGGDSQSCQDLLPTHSRRWELLEKSCAGGITQACLQLAQASSDDPGARDPRRATAWLEAACTAGDSDSCTRVQASTAPVVALSPEGIAVDGALQVRFSGGTRWAYAPGSTEGALIRPVYGALRSLARDRQLGAPTALSIPPVLHIDSDAPVERVQDLLYTASQAGWRSFRMSALEHPERMPVNVWLPSEGSASPLPPLALAAAAARPSGVVVQGSVDPVDLQQGLREHRPAIRACWDKAVRIDPNQGGSVELRFVVGVDGWVNDAAIRASELGNPQLEACIVHAFEGMRFNAPTGGGIATIDYEMLLEAVYTDPDDQPQDAD